MVRQQRPALLRWPVAAYLRQHLREFHLPGPDAATPPRDLFRAKFVLVLQPFEQRGTGTAPLLFQLAHYVALAVQITLVLAVLQLHHS